MSPTTIVAHRGLHHVVPENSIEAFRAAWDAGIEWCECDVHLTADATPLVIHDATLDHSTTASGRVDATLSTSLLGTRLRSRDGTPAAARLPRLGAITPVLRADPLRRLMVEIKPSDGGETARCVVPMLDHGQCLVQSFDQDNLLSARRHDPRMPLAWLVDRADLLAVAADSPWPAIHVDHRLLRDELIVQRLRRRGKRVGVWTVNAPEDIRRALALGVDTIITDEPTLTRSLANEFAA